MQNRGLARRILASAFHRVGQALAQRHLLEFFIVLSAGRWTSWRSCRPERSFYRHLLSSAYGQHLANAVASGASGSKRQNFDRTKKRYFRCRSFASAYAEQWRNGG